MKPATIKQKSAEDHWNSETYHQNRIAYSANGTCIKEYDSSNFNIKCLSVDEDCPAYVSDEIVVAVGEHVSKAQVLKRLRSIIRVIVG